MLVMYNPISTLNNYGKIKRNIYAKKNWYYLIISEIEKLVNKVIEKNPDTVENFRNPRRTEFAHCFLGGVVYKYLYFLTVDINLISHLYILD